MPTVRDYLRSLYAREGRRRDTAYRLQRWIKAAPLFAAGAAIALVMLGIGTWWRSAVFSMMSERSVSHLESVSFLLTPERGKNTVEIGWKDIGQEPGARNAEDRHVEFAIDINTKAVTARNIAQTKKLWLQYKGLDEWWTLFGYRLFRVEPPFETFAERLPIQRGVTSSLFAMGGVATFRNVTPTSFDLEITNPNNPNRLPRKFEYRASRGSDGLQSVGGHSWNTSCQAPGILARVRRSAADLFDLARRALYASVGRTWLPASEIDIAVLGGDHDCIEDGRKQIGRIGALRWRELKIVRRGGWFMIAPYDSAERRKLPVALGVVSPPQPLAMRQHYANARWQIDAKGSWGEIDEMIIGRTEYQVGLCRNGAAQPPRLCQGVHVPGDSVRVVLTPKSKILVFNAPDCREKDRREHCPSPIDIQSTPPAEAFAPPCGDADVKCWRWSRTHNMLHDASGSAAVTRLSGWERAMRIAIVLSAAFIVLGVAFNARSRLERRREGLLAARSASTPIRWVLVSALLTLAPEVATFLGTPLDAHWAFTIMLANWWLAGAVLLAGTSGLALGLLWVAVMLLCAIGTTTLAAMAVDGGATSWTQYFVRQKYLFLDLVPPMVLMVASLPPRTLRPVLQELVVGLRPRYRWVLWVPSMALLALFGLWLMMGSQTGLGVFQPAEAGKFAAVLLAATALLRLDPDIQRSAVSRNLAVRIVSFAMLALFFGVLITVPSLRNDWSPALIMGLLMGGLLAAFILPVCWRTVLGAWRRRVARHQVPLVFRPKPRSAPFGPVMRSLMILVVIIVGLVTALPVMKFTAKWMLSLNEWSSESHERLELLEAYPLGSGRRVVAERIIAWTDLMYSTPMRASCRFPSELAKQGKAETAAATPRACYRDLEWQVVRARHVVAQAECGIKSPLDPADDPILRRVGAALQASTAPARMLASLLPTRAICGQESTEPAVQPSAPEIVRPIQIPVVESDFAGAYLFGRFGVGAAVLLYAGQALLLGVVVYTFIRFSSRTSSGNQLDTGLRRFIGVVVAGTGLLFLLQWLFSWSNTLGLLPVMGQPMTLLSYAVSHHLFMALPCLIVLVVALRLVSYDQARMVPRGVPRRGSWRLFG